MTANSSHYAHVTEIATIVPVSVWSYPDISKNTISPSQSISTYADVQQILVSNLSIGFFPEILFGSNHNKKNQFVRSDPYINMVSILLHNTSGI